MKPNQENVMLSVDNLSVVFSTTGSLQTQAVSNVSFDLKKGETLVLLGESGSGKSVTLWSLIGLHSRKKSIVSGSIVLDGKQIIGMPDSQLSKIRGAVASIVFQEPGLALNPVQTIGSQLIETIKLHQECSHQEAHKRSIEALDLVRIPAASQRMQSYPHELSGGTKQRAMLAIALSCKPKLLLADEPTTGLDTTVQMQLIVHLREIVKDAGTSMVFVTHDLGCAAEIADQIAVMYAGSIVEYGAAFDVLINPQHPYTQGLIKANVSDKSSNERLFSMPGFPPVLNRLPTTCAFHDRCIQACDRGRDSLPKLVNTNAESARRDVLWRVACFSKM